MPDREDKGDLWDYHGVWNEKDVMNMTQAISNKEGDIDDQISLLRKKISSLEWDLPNISNGELREHREKELLRAKSRLAKLLLGGKDGI